MTERRQPQENLGHWVERLIAKAQEEGQFDNLEGAGRPLPDLDQPDDEYWWIRRWLKRNNLSIIPREFELRKKVETTLEEIPGLSREGDVRRRLEALNSEIGRHNATVIAGPTASVPMLDIERIVVRWKSRREPADGNAAGA